MRTSRAVCPYILLTMHYMEVKRSIQVSIGRACAGVGQWSTADTLEWDRRDEQMDDGFMDERV